MRKSPSAPLQREEINILGEAGNESYGFTAGESQLMAKCPRKRQTCLSASPQFPPTSAAHPDSKPVLSDSAVSESALGA